VVGQRGDYAINDLGGNGSGNAQGGSTINSRLGYSGGQGGQASSLFYYSGSAYITKAVAGAGGGGGVASGQSGGDGAPGGNGGGAAPIVYATSAGSGNNGVAGAGGTSPYTQFYEAADGSSGGNYGATATTTGVSSLSLVGGNGGNCGKSSGLGSVTYPPPNGGGGGGGYGGGGGGAMTYYATPTSYGPGGGGGGGGSYGDIVIAGNSTTPGNTGDPNYANSAGYGGNNSSAGSDGLIVLILQGAVANVPATVVASGLTANSLTTSSLTASNLTANNMIVSNLTTSSLTVSNLLVNGMITGSNGVGGVLGYTSPTNGVALSWNSQFVSIPGILYAGQFISTGAGAEINFYDRGGLTNYGQWSYYAQNGKAYFWNSIVGNRMSIGTNGNIQAVGSFIANTTPDLAETIPAADNVEAGDIVCADPQHSESVVRCNRDSQGILGVISDGTSGFIINANGKSVDAPLTGRPLVLAGRVPVKVSLENGPIKIGDYLTPSSIPGVAMRANGIGTVIGVALAPFDATHQEAWGQAGKVLCFVKIGDASSTSKINQLEEQNNVLADRLQKLEKMVQSLEGK
jgi:hypothetical protein